MRCAGRCLCAGDLVRCSRVACSIDSSGGTEAAAEGGVHCCSRRRKLRGARRGQLLHEPHHCTDSPGVSQGKGDTAEHESGVRSGEIGKGEGDKAVKKEIEKEKEKEKKK